MQKITKSVLSAISLLMTVYMLIITITDISDLYVSDFSLTILWMITILMFIQIILFIWKDSWKVSSLIGAIVLILGIVLIINSTLGFSVVIANLIITILLCVYSLYN